jgi:hypothetical protein
MPLSLRRVGKFVFTKVISIHKAAEIPEASGNPATPSHSSKNPFRRPSPLVGEGLAAA